MAVFAAAATISSHPTFSYGCSRVTSIDCRFRTRAVLTHRPKDLEQAASASVENGKFHTRSSVENPRFRNGSLVENGRVANGSPCFSLTITKTALDDDDKMEEGGRPDINDYVQWSKRMVESTKKDGGPPRWFSPVDCGGTTCYQWRSSSDALPKPLFLYIPGIDGVGLGLISQHQRLGKIFDIWCLHIPVTNRMPFKDMVQLVETTVKAEKYRSPDRPIYLAGESIGACLALAVAARNPDIDLILLLANPATSFSKSHLQSLIYLLQITPTELLLGVPYILGIFTGDPFRLLMDNMEKGISIQQIVQELPESFAALLLSFSALADILPGETILWKLQMLQSASSFVNCRLSSIKADVLILSSGRDNLLPSRDEAKRLSDILPSCRVRNFRDSGPTLLMEKGFDLVTIIKGAGFFRLRRNMDYVLDYMPPTSSEFKQLTDSYRWFTMVTSPVMFSTLEDSTIVRGLSGIPCKGPVVFVSYHMLMGMDLVPLIESFFSEKNIVLRGMAHPMLFGKAMERETYDPSFNDAVRLMGGVPVTGTNIFKLLSSKSHILLFPGGVREALHRKDEDYKLFWPSRSEFVRMAARFGAKIVPFGVVGEDDLVDVILDYNDQVKIPLLKDLIGQLNDGRFERLRTEISDGVTEQDIYMPALLPKVPGRLYYLFGKPIETEGRRQELRNKEKADELYVHVKSEVERHIAYLKKKREKDPYRTLFSRMVYQATHGFTSQVPTFNI